MTVTRGVKILARSGYAARGMVYLIIGFFAFAAALGSGDTVDSKGALQKVLEHPFGAVLLWLLAIGLFAHVAWRFTQGIGDTDRHGTDAKALLIRAGLIGSALVNLALALFTLSLLGAGLESFSGGGGGGDKPDVLARLLGHEASRWLIYVVALIPLGAGIAHLIKAWHVRYERYFECDEHVMQVVRPISRIGLVARGIVFLIIATLLLIGGNRYEVSDPPGLKEALEALQGWPLGSWLLMAIGLGLLAFALYSFAQALWRRIDLQEVLD
ncbi:DUF1206 domain-containing protein [Pseudomonas mangrovi]|uniref:DUF1206 domain-containing protein n=1 Tax=Pseudomonas mangrovi TaxID=2161748 RepID=A0A2T5P9J0_9PSED|nr:DUF1206 domain-containing protein [Pseudomonas mangrovi]PTU74375.1 DUF1206 domain-containing protein [Pseudomonas mangrovi]